MYIYRDYFQVNVSFLGHLGGALCGVIAWLLIGRNEQIKQKKEELDIISHKALYGYSSLKELDS